MENWEEQVRIEWKKKSQDIRDENDYLSTKVIADWWIKKLSSQKKEIVEKSIGSFPKGSIQESVHNAYSPTTSSFL